MTVPCTGARENFPCSFRHTIYKTGVICSCSPADTVSKWATICGVCTVASGVSGEGFFGLAVVHDGVDTSDSANSKEENGGEAGNDFFIDFAFGFEISRASE